MNNKTNELLEAAKKQALKTTLCGSTGYYDKINDLFANAIIKKCANVCREQKNPPNLNYKPSLNFAAEIENHFRTNPGLLKEIILAANNKANDEISDFSSTRINLTDELIAKTVVNKCVDICNEQREPGTLNYKLSERFADALQSHFKEDVVLQNKPKFK